MRIHRFFVKEQTPQKGEFIVSDTNLLNQWRNVLRMKAGDRLVAFDGTGDEAFCELSALDKKSATLLILEKKKGLAPAREITLFMSLIKRDNFELVLEKATELGVSRIVPVEVSRSEKKGLNRERSEKILREASEQSGRATVPVLGDVVNIKDIFRVPIGEAYGDSTHKEPIIVLDPRGLPIGEAYGKGVVGLVIGPEGGFTDEEIKFFKTNGTPILSTGATILRAETAAIVALALVLAK